MINILLAIIGGIVVGNVAGLCLKYETYVFEKKLQDMKDGKIPWDS